MDENQGKPEDNAGKTQKQFSTQERGYDYDHAISEAARLWNLLKERHASRHWKYPPRDAAFEHLLSAWKMNPGRTFVHLSDLPDFVHVTLDIDGIELLKKEWSALVAEHGFREASREHEAIYHSAAGSHQTTSVYELRKLALERDLSFDDYVVGIRPGANGKPFKTKLPVRIDTEQFGELFGFYGDLIHKKLVHVTKDKEVQEEFLRTVSQALGSVDISTQTRGKYSTTYSTTTIKHFFNIAGIDTNIRQLKADNPTPLFLFAAADNVVRAYLRSLFESEGGPNYVMKRNATVSIDLHQAVICNPPNYCVVPRHPRKVSYRQIGSPDNLLDRPPRLLVSASLLMLRFDINNRLWPADLYTNELNEKVMRWRLMITGPDIQSYKSQIGFISTRKQLQLS